VTTLDLASPADVFELMARTEESFAGLDWETLAGHRQLGPSREREHVG
jgi:hypothetical protein